ncbi:hypothetical protein [Acrocarpospora catenulata]|uniref:hypothetical protein n=1 Tax=Acrocarpospora catenulata TaxID=2836182 RepID=UPI001BDB4778|nr:hypothetical protein [Acrocarpospora catenulata]
MPVLATHTVEVAGPRLIDPVVTVLAAEFRTVAEESVARCVADVWACAEHLGVEVTPAIIERIAREHLLALVNSAHLLAPGGRKLGR